MVTTADPADIAEPTQLLERARAGDAQAFCLLAEHYEARLLQQAHGLTRDSATAEDLVSETLVEAWRCLGRFSGACRFSTWLFSILLHRYQKWVRRARSRPISLAALTRTDLERHREMLETLPSPEPSPADEAQAHESALRIRAAIEALPDKHRQVVLLRFFEEASLAEIAALLDCSVGTVKSRLHYALEKLRESQAGLNLSE